MNFDINRWSRSNKLVGMWRYLVRYLVWYLVLVCQIRIRDLDQHGNSDLAKFEMVQEVMSVEV